MTEQKSRICVVADPKDEIRLLRVINTPARGIGEKSVETARAIARDQALSLFEVLEHADSYPSLSRASVRMREFARMIRELQGEQLTSDALYDRVLEKTGYITMLEQSRDERDESRVDNVHELKSSILAYQNESGDTSLPGYLASIALYTDVDSMDGDEDSVILMTIHSAKGVEFPVVYVVGMEEGLFPGLRSIGEQDEMEEERRLCYVAFTRAKNRLVVSHARQRMLYGKTTANRTSRFLEESGLDLEEPRLHSSSYSDPRVRAGSGWPYSPSLSRSRTGASAVSAKHSTIIPSPAVSLPEFSVGQRVHHNAFGDGTVMKMTPMGGDQLMEISFDEHGSKKLMLKAAARYLKSK